MSIQSITEPNDDKSLNLYCNSITTNSKVVSRREFEPMDLQSLSNNWRFFVPLTVPDPLNPPEPLLDKMNWLIDEDDDFVSITGKCRASSNGLFPAGFTFDVPTTINLNKTGNMNFFGRARTKLSNDAGGTDRTWNLTKVDVSQIGVQNVFLFHYTTLKGLQDTGEIVDIHFEITYQK